MSNAFLTQFAGTLEVIAALSVSALLWMIVEFIYHIITRALSKVLSESQANWMASIIGGKNTEE